MRYIRRPFQLIRENLRAYLLLSAIAYAAYIVGTAAGMLSPDLYAALSGGLEESGDAATVQGMVSTPWWFAANILGVNLWRIVTLKILLPSMVVPFLGIPLYLYWAFQTGVVLAPVDQASTIAMIPHSLTVVLEFQAYAVVLLGVYLLGRAVVRPAAVDAATRPRAYLHGLRTIAWLAPIALLLFILGALYEAFSLYLLAVVLPGMA